MTVSKLIRLVLVPVLLFIGLITVEQAILSHFAAENSFWEGVFAFVSPPLNFVLIYFLNLKPFRRKSSHTLNLIRLNSKR